MRNIIYCGGTPAEEKCVGVGDDPFVYLPLMRAESVRYKKQLQRMFPLLDGMQFSLLRQEHDYGPYIEVVLYYDGNNKEQAQLAVKVDAGLPDYWD